MSAEQLNRFQKSTLSLRECNNQTTHSDHTQMNSRIVKDYFVYAEPRSNVVR